MPHSSNRWTTGVEWSTLASPSATFYAQDELNRIVANGYGYATYFSPAQPPNTEEFLKNFFETGESRRGVYFDEKGRRLMVYHDGLMLVIKDDKLFTTKNVMKKYGKVITPLAIREGIEIKAQDVTPMETAGREVVHWVWKNPPQDIDDSAIVEFNLPKVTDEPIYNLNDLPF